MGERVFKILTGPQWALWVEQGVSLGSPADWRDGFIHFSAAHQVSRTLAKHFDADHRLWLVEADEHCLGMALRWEAASNGQLYPHLYAPFHRWQAIRDWPTARSAAGQWPLPEGLIP